MEGRPSENGDYDAGGHPHPARLESYDDTKKKAGPVNSLSRKETKANKRNSSKKRRQSELKSLSSKVYEASKENKAIEKRMNLSPEQKDKLKEIGKSVKADEARKKAKVYH